MDRHLLQYSSDEHDYHDQIQHEMDPLLHAALLGINPYGQHHNLTSSLSLPISPHDRTSAQSTPTNPHPPLYHIPQSNPQTHQQALPHSGNRHFSAPGPQPTPNPSQTTHQAYPQHNVLSSSTQVPSQGCLSTHVPQIRPPQAPTRSAVTHNQGPMILSHQQGSQAQLSSSDEPQMSIRIDRMSRLGSHGGVGRRIMLSSPGADGGGVPLTSGVGSNAAGQGQATKDVNGKFPCSHCNKTYLHLKHLKRHLLRHTGDRPYQCVLCKDTFSRSDILKRHFQKCSIRRGNPSGFTHLAHAHDHQRGKKSKNGREELPPQDLKAGSHEFVSSGVDTTSNQLVTPSSTGSLRRSTRRSCGACSQLKFRCDGNCPCSRCQQAGTECIYSDDRPRVSSSEEQDLSTRREVFNFQPPTHPHAHLQTHHDSIQSYQHTEYQSNTPTAASPPYTPATDGPYGSLGETHSLSTTSLPDSYNFHQEQTSLRHGLTTSHDDLASIHSQSEGNGVALSQQETPLFYLDANTTSESASNQSTGEIDWNFPHTDVFYATIPSSNLTLQTNDGSIFGYNNTPLTGTPISLMDGVLDWNMPLQSIDPFQAKCENIRNILFSDYQNRLSSPEYAGTPPSDDETPPPDDSDLKQWVTADHIVHFWEQFCVHFQTHFPAMHVPTFQLGNAYDGLVMALMCYGAVYSDRGITVYQVRRLMERCMLAIEHDPRGYSPEQATRVLTTEELHARLMFAALCTWHGSEKQRERSRKNHGKLVALARNSYFFRPLTPRDNSPDGWSYYHQTDKTLKLNRTWDWAMWAEQEQRNRVMFGIYLLDAAFVIYYNEKPRIGIYDLKITLPADDACWEATSAEECANLLGLNGSEASAANVSGTRKPKQPELAQQVEELLTIGKEFRQGTTNIYTKFILIHAIHVYIWQKQKEFGLDQWGGYSHHQLNTQRSIAQQKSLEILHFNQTVAQALDKWKRCWDADLAVQYPNKKRSGFCRDGIAFYWLAVLFTRQKKRDLVLRDVQDRQVMMQVQQMLETVNRRPKGSIPPEEHGATSEIDRTYGVDDLAFDMKLLLVPIDKRIKEEQKYDKKIDKWDLQGKRRGNDR